jgi:hypothetical protein
MNSKDWRDRSDEGLKDISTYMAKCLVDYVLNTAKTCVLCKHFDEPTEICKLNGKRPPAKIIAYGCECFDELERFRYGTAPK